ncbi:hypothetical protein V8E53_000382 [Lactarius tabidus]
MQQSVNHIEAASQAIWLWIAQKEQSDKSTATSYARHVDAYATWWETYQAGVLDKDPGQITIPAFLITPAKAMMFLEYTSTQPKCRHGSSEKIPGSVMGLSIIKQTISALEHHRFQHQHLHKDDPKSQIRLCLDACICHFESAAKHNEPKCAESAQVLKASGSSSDTYTREELKQCLLFCLTDFKGPKEIFLGLCDQVMLLLSTSTALHGGSCHAIELSDLFPSTIPLPDGDGLGIEVLGILLDNAKHNQTGHVDEHGVICHCHIELCPINAVAMLLWAMFHLKQVPVPSFVPNFADPNFGDIAHNNRINLIHIRNDVSITKSTHAGRPYAAQTAQAHGASVSSTKALGGWSESGSFQPCYDHAFLADALLSAAMFNAWQSLGAHFQPRDTLEPPAELLAAVFPWVEQEQDKLAQSRMTLPSSSSSACWCGFTEFFCKTVPYCVQSTPPAQCTVIHHLTAPCFSSLLVLLSVVDQAEEEACHALKNLPDNIAATFCGLATDMKMDQHSQHLDLVAHWDAVDSWLDQVTDLLHQFIGSKSFKGCKAKKVLGTPQTLHTTPGHCGAALSISPPQAFVPSSTATIPNITINISNPSVGTQESGLTCVTTASPHLTTHLAGPNLSHSSTQHQPNIPEYQGRPMTPAQLAKWNSLTMKYGEVCVYRHTWDWVQGDFLPVYLYQSADQLTDYWTEWTEGIGGYLSTRELTEGLGAKWQQNNGGQQTECGRRKRVIDLVIALSDKPNWDVCLALRFLKEKYEGLYSPRKFCDWLKPENVQAVLAAAGKYCHQSYLNAYFNRINPC